MWIKTKNNSLVNLDCVSKIYYDSGTDATYYTTVSGSHHPLFDGNQIDFLEEVIPSHGRD